MVVAAGIFNLLAVPLIRGAAEAGRDSTLLIGPLVMGILPAEVGGLAFWLVWGEESFLRRLAIHWAVAVCLLGCFLFGVLVVVLSDGGIVREAWQVVAAVLCLFPVLSLATQLPMWPLRTHFGWRVERVRLNTLAEKPAPLSILDILSGTAVVALALGLVCAAPIRVGEFVWVQLVMSTLWIVATSVLCLLPAIICVLRFTEARVGMVVFAAYIFLGFIGLISVPAVLTNNLPPGEVILAFLIGLVAFAVTLSAPLVLLRIHGYRLVFSGDRR